MKISKKIELNYNISFGKMSKWLTGLTEGFALALKCSLCEKVSFPPQKICTCGAYKNSWIKLSGVAEIVTITSGLDGNYGLVKFEGASTLTVVKLNNFKGTETFGKILKSSSQNPSIIITPTEVK